MFVKNMFTWIFVLLTKGLIEDNFWNTMKFIQKMIKLVIDYSWFFAAAFLTFLYLMCFRPHTRWKTELLVWILKMFNQMSCLSLWTNQNLAYQRLTNQNPASALTRQITLTQMMRKKRHFILNLTMWPWRVTGIIRCCLGPSLCWRRREFR